MKKSEDPKFKALDWYLDFTSVDLSNLAEVEFRKLLLDAQNHFTSFAPTSPYSHGLGAYLKYTGKKIDVDEIPNDFPWEENLRRIQKELKSILQKVLSWRDIKDELSWLKTFEIRADVGLHLGFFDGKIRTLILQPSNSFDLMNMARTNFIRLLSDLSPDVIRNCEECGKFYLHLAKRPRRFCTPKCTSKAMSRERRERDPEEYRKRQRELMRRKYEEKKHKALGPKTKVAHRK